MGVEYQPSDGWAIVHLETADVAPLRECIEIIQEKGVLSYDDFDSLTI